jgi:hypothetical protein
MAADATAWLKQAVTSLGLEATRCYKRAQRQAFLQWRDQEDPSQFGLASRFTQEANQVGGNGVIPGPRAPYGTTARAYAVSATGNRRTAQGVLPPYRHTGAMRRELLARRPKTTTAGDVISTRFSLHHRSLNLWGRQRGILRQHRQRQAQTYLMTCYRDSVNKAGAFKQQVTRSVMTTVRYQAPWTYGDEWRWSPRGEVASIRRSADQLLGQYLRSLVLDRRGNVRARFRGRIPDVEVA